MQDIWLGLGSFTEVWGALLRSGLIAWLAVADAWDLGRN